MKKTSEMFVGKQAVSRFLSFAMVVLMAFSFVSCGDDDDEPNGGGNDGPSASIVTPSDLAGEWTLVQDKVLYSAVDVSKDDEVISYSGNSSPYYHYYKVVVGDDDAITITEVTASGSVVGKPAKYELEGNDLVTGDGDVAGTIINFNESHAWDNLKIEWNKEYSPISFNAPVISTYML